MNSSTRCDEIVRIIDQALADNEASGVTGFVLASDEPAPRRLRRQPRLGGWPAVTG